MDELLKRPGLFLLLLVPVLLMTFSVGLHSPTFINHEESILRLPLSSSWKNIPLIFSRDFLMFSDGQFRPLSYALLASVRTLVGPEHVLFWHIWLLVFHGLNAVLIFVLVRQFSKRLGGAVLASLVFGLHPLASVVVNTINYFHYVLGLSFYLGALCCYLSFTSTLRKGRYLAAVALFVLGVFTSKVVFTLPIVLAGYEVLYRRSGVRRVLTRILPFLVFSLAVSPLWWFYKPHPLHYKYMEFPTRAGWYSFFSVVGATGWYLRGLASGWGIPVVMYEVVERIFNPLHWEFLLWGGIDLGILVLAGWALRRGWWAGLGILLAFGAMLPFASTQWNGVEEYVAWVYLYFPSAGFSLLVGGLAERIWASSQRAVRRGALMGLGLLVFFYGVEQMRLNLASRSAIRYWGQVLRLNPNSEVASLELGKAYLSQGELKQALGFLFSPPIRRISDVCLVMTRYYCAQGDYQAAAVHFKMAGHREGGLLYQDYETAAAELFYGAGALDHAEEVLGRCLKANPYNLKAMERLAQVWLLKGHVRAADKLVERAMEIAPSGPQVGQMRMLLEARQRAGADYRVVIHPFDPEWLRYVTEGAIGSRVQETIVQIGERYPDDPIIQLEVATALVRKGQNNRALSKLDRVTKALPSFAYAWAVKCWAALRAGDDQAAEAYGRRALELDPEISAVHTALGMLSVEEDDVDQAMKRYQQALRINPNHAVAHNNLGNILARQGKLEEAIEQYRQALEIRADFLEAHNNLGIALARQGKFQEAITQFSTALRIKPDYAEAYNNLGLAFAETGDMEKALSSFRQALCIHPDYAKALSNLVAVLTRWGRFGEAVSVLRDRRTEKPDDLDVTLSLAWLLATSPDASIRNGKEAIRLAEQVCQAGAYRSPQALRVLAAAYAEEGRYEEAVHYAQRALRLSTEGGMNELANQIEAQLKLYRSHQPYRFR